jgi:RNase P subunit RPR2
MENKKEYREYFCRKCGCLVAEIKTGSRLKRDMTMLCQACSNYDVLEEENGAVGKLRKMFGME